MCFVIYPTLNDTARNNPIQGVPAQRGVSYTSPPSDLLVACSGLSTSFCSCQGCWTKTFPEKSHEVLFGSVGWSRWRIQEQGSEEAGGGTRLFPPGVVSGWIRLKCIVKLLHQGNVHTQWTPQSCHPDIPNGYAKFRPREKWLSTFSNAFLLNEVQKSPVILLLLMQMKKDIATGLNSIFKTTNV